MDVFTGSLVHPTTLGIPGQLSPGFEGFMKVKKGDTLRTNLYLNKDGEPFDFTTAVSVQLSIRRNLGEDPPLFTKTLADGLVQVETGILQLELLPAETDTMEPGIYYWELQIEEVSGFVLSPLSGTLTISQDFVPN